MLFFLWSGLIHFFKVKANIFFKISEASCQNFVFWAQLSVGPIVRAQLARAQFAGYDNNSRAFLIAISSAVNMLVEGERDQVFEMFRIGMYTAEAVRLRFGQREPSV